MDEYKWFKDDFENDIKKSSDSFDKQTYENKDAQADGGGDNCDFNTSGEQYMEYTSEEDGTTFYSTNIKPKKSRRRATALTAEAGMPWCAGRMNAMCRKLNWCST